MIQLHKEMSDAEAYERARVANECKPLMNSAIIKCMCGYDTGTAKLLGTLSNMTAPLSQFLGDDVYTCNASIFSIVDKSKPMTLDKDFTKMIVKTKNLSSIDSLITNTIFPDDVVAKLKTAKDDTETKMNTAIASMGSFLHPGNNSHHAAIALVYISLFLAIINYNETTGAPGDMTDAYITDANILKMLQDYMDLPRSEKGENHKRLYCFFRTGTFPNKRHADE